MGKKTTAKDSETPARPKTRKISDYPEVSQLLDRLNGGQPSDLISLFVPSVDRFHHPVFNRETWRGFALDTFARLFGGATEFPGLMGIWRDKTGVDHKDNVVLLESLVDRDKLTADVLYEFIEFCRAMGVALNQLTVLATFNGKAIWIDIKHPDAD